MAKKRSTTIERLVYKWRVITEDCLRVIAWTRDVCWLFFSEWNLWEECTRKRERMWTRGRVLGAEWNGWDNCTALKTPTKYPPPKSYTSPSPVAPSHSNYEPRAGRSEYNFLYCVNVRTYVWIRKMFILQKKKKKIQFAYFYSTTFNRTLKYEFSFQVATNAQDSITKLVAHANLLLDWQKFRQWFLSVYQVY